MRFENGSWQIEANGVRNSVGFDWHPINGNYILQITEETG